MFNTGAMVTVDLNADLAEGDALTATDLAVLDEVTSVSLACGFHAGNRELMRATAIACLARGVTIGAHVSYRDRAGFGRTPIEREPSQLVADILEQCEVLSDEVGAAGGTVAYVKPHGALYNRMGVDPVVAASVIEALSLRGIGVLVAQTRTAVVEPARRADIRVVPEGFPDRGYRADGLLAERGDPGSLITDPAVAGLRAVSLVCRGGIDAIDGSWTAIEARTLCIHGDAPDAVEAARAVRTALTGAGVTIRAFVPAEPTGSTAAGSR
jgi:5-oxoprolinase (ATP-hydrolysing) subunit A